MERSCQISNCQRRESSSSSKVRCKAQIALAKQCQILKPTASSSRSSGTRLIKQMLPRFSNLKTRLLCLTRSVKESSDLTTMQATSPSSTHRRKTSRTPFQRSWVRSYPLVWPTRSMCNRISPFLIRRVRTARSILINQRF